MVEGDVNGARPGTRQVVADIWAELLGRHPEDGDDFFELGGHSLLAARATARARRVLGVRLDLSLLIDHPVLSTYVEHVEVARRRESG